MEELAKLEAERGTPGYGALAAKSTGRSHWQEREREGVLQVMKCARF